jgi:hypothetical protein
LETRAVTGDEPVRFFFIHVMKTGGTSFVRQILANFEPDEVYPSEIDRTSPSDVARYSLIPNLRELSPERRARIRVYAGHLSYVASELLGIELVRLTLLRDPVDRAVSMLRHCKLRLEPYSELSLEAIYDDDVAFRRFLDNQQTKVFALTAEERARALAAMETQADDAPLARTLPVEPRRFDQAKVNLAKVDVIGLSECYGDFVNELHTRYGWWPNGVKEHVRTNVTSDRWPVSASLRRRIGDDLQVDVEFYEYAKELVAARRRSS